VQRYEDAMVSGGIAFNLKGWAIMLEIGVACIALAATFVLSLPLGAAPWLVSATNELCRGCWVVRGGLYRIRDLVEKTSTLFIGTR